VIHADLFPDNVLMLGDRVTGLIDFYFACNDTTAYDVAVTHAAWCFDSAGKAFHADISAALLEGYESVRPLLPEERAALPVLAQGAAIRFTASRAYDWLNTPADALVTRKDPMAFARRLAFYADPANAGSSREARPDFHRRRVQGQPRQGRLGRAAAHGRTRNGPLRKGDDQQPHGTDGRDQGARSAHAALPGDAAYRQQVRAGRHHQVGLRLAENGWKTADRKPVKNDDLWRALVAAARPHKIEWVWVKGHDGHPENERVDRLASDAAQAA
jgi:hypothetical protein